MGDPYSQSIFLQAIRGLVGLVFLFDLYTIYQHLLIHRIRKQLFEREAMFHLISENAADMMAVVDMEGRRIYNSLSYQKGLGYSPEELQASSALAGKPSRNISKRRRRPQPSQAEAFRRFKRTQIQRRNGLTVGLCSSILKS